MISSRAIALQGVGFAAALMAVQGFAPSEVVITPPLTAQVQPVNGGGGLDGGHGTGYVWRDNAWVKATKFAKVGLSNQGTGKATSGVSVSSVARRTLTSHGHGIALTRADVQGVAMRNEVTQPRMLATCHSEALSMHTKMLSSSYNGTCEALSMDEIMVLIEMTT